MTESKFKRKMRRINLRNHDRKQRAELQEQKEQCSKKNV